MVEQLDIEESRHEAVEKMTAPATRQPGEGSSFSIRSSATGNLDGAAVSSRLSAGRIPWM
jgi:hypothetical protein